jgi:membrane glycosyltransferase
MKVKLLFVVLFCWMFANTASSVVSFAQTLDRVTAAKVAQINQQLPE